MQWKLSDVMVVDLVQHPVTQISCATLSIEERITVRIVPSFPIERLGRRPYFISSPNPL